jgi:CheY-like chemotaxis protein
MKGDFPLLMEDLDVPTILVIEDDPTIRLTLRAVFESEGYDVLSASNGKAGLELLRVMQPPSLILLDLMMPVMTGWEFLREIQKDTKVSPIPVVVMSAGGITPLTHAKHFLKKPLDIDDLLQIAVRFCKPSSPQDSRKVSIES